MIADKDSPYSGLIKDILVEDGKLISIEENIECEDAEKIEADNLLISQGWVDVFTDFCDPGYEYKESLESGADSAIEGGFSHVFVIPNIKPVTQNKSQVAYIVEKAKLLPINIYPLGAISKNTEGKDLAEMYEMKQTGAIAFSDGLHPVQSSGLLLKALQYINAFNGTIIQVPIDKSIGSFGLMTEGIISTQLGLPGSPALSEILIIKRDLDLLRYTNSTLHITGITTAESVDLIAAAKKEGLSVSSSVTPYHLYFCDEDMVSYDTNLKVTPPLRTRSDMMALREAVKDGTIDAISTHHLPQNWDNKTCEFEYAAHGMIGLQTCFSVINHLIPELSPERIAALFSTNARRLFKLPDNKIEVGAHCDFTLFSKSEESIFKKENNRSKSLNSAFFDLPLTGKVIGVFTKGNWHKSKY